jgi:hypothetical protein
VPGNPGSERSANSLAWKPWKRKAVGPFVPQETTRLLICTLPMSPVPKSRLQASVVTRASRPPRGGGLPRQRQEHLAHGKPKGRRRGKTPKKMFAPAGAKETAPVMCPGSGVGTPPTPRLRPRTRIAEINNLNSLLKDQDFSITYKQSPPTLALDTRTAALKNDGYPPPRRDR